MSDAYRGPHLSPDNPSCPHCLFVPADVDLSGVEMTPGRVEVIRDETPLLTLADALAEAVERCESNRGRFSCVEAHDSRCAYQLYDKNGRREDRVCECGGDALDAAIAAYRAARPRA